MMGHFSYDAERRLLRAGDRSWPAQWKSADREDDFAYRHRQAIVMLESGHHISTIWGTGTYSTNRDSFPGQPPQPFTEEPAHVEIAVLLGGEHMAEFGVVGDEWHDTVRGWVDVDDFTMTADWLAQLPSDVDAAQTFVPIFHADLEAMLS